MALTNVAEAFKGVAVSVNSPSKPCIKLGQFVQACRLLSPLLCSLGVFKFAEKEYSAKVGDLAEAANSIDTLETLLDRDIQNNVQRDSNSHSRNLVRVKRSVDMLRIMFEQILATGGNSLIAPVTTAYKQVFAPYHGWAIRTGVYIAMVALPTRTQLLRNLNEDEASARVQMQNFVRASTSVIQYINQLFHSKKWGDELLRMI